MPGRPSIRIWAVALPSIAVSAGLVAPRSRTVALGVRLAATLAPGLAVLLAVAGRRGSRRANAGGHDGEPLAPAAAPAPVAGLPAARRPVDVLIAARDEAAVIGPLLDDLAAQDLRREDGSLGFRITVIDDRSVDGTGDVALRTIAANRIDAAAGVLRRTSGTGGKGAALASFAEPAGGIVIVLDADARIPPDTIRRLAIAVGQAPGEPTGQPTGERTRAATARRRMMRPARGIAARVMARLQDDEETIDGAVQLGRLELGGGSELRGNGMVVAAAALAEAGGWPHDAVCEDLELSTRLFRRSGRGAVWLPDVPVWEQPVLDLDRLIAQRLRWAEGAIRRDVREVLPALVDPSLPLRGRIDLATYAAHLLLGWLTCGLVVSGASGRRLAVALLGGYAAATLVLAADALHRFGDGSDGPWRIAARAIGVTAFAGAWLPVTTLAWVRAAVHGDTVHFARTIKSAGFVPSP